MARLPKLVRALSRRVSGSTPSEPQPRAGSLPFISGDTFRSVAEIILEDGRDIVQHGLHTGVIFASAQTSLGNDFLEQLAKARNALAIPNYATLVIHNGDHVPSAEQFEAIRRIVPRVFSKNVLDDIPGVTPIPIGLENVALKHNGKLHYYLDALHNPTPSQLRTRRVLSSFHESTNRAMREPVKDLMVHSRHGHERDFAKSLDYRLEVRQTKFVISPPGNGMDCHRTWEAIYLGAVPVILKGFLAPSLYRDLPVLAVDSYEEFLTYDDTTLDQIYEDLKSKPLANAWGWTWLRQVFSPPRLEP